MYFEVQNIKRYQFLDLYVFFNIFQRKLTWYYLSISPFSQMHESPTINNHILKYLLFLPDISGCISAKNNLYLYIHVAILKKYFENCTVNRDSFKEGEYVT